MWSRSRPAAVAVGAAAVTEAAARTVFTESSHQLSILQYRFHDVKYRLIMLFVGVPAGAGDTLMSFSARGDMFWR